MCNEIKMDVKLGFGRYETFTGQQLLEREDGTDYLVWAYTKTDIPMCGRVVAELVKRGLVSLSLNRTNSKDMNHFHDPLSLKAFEVFSANRHTIKDEHTGDRVAKMINRWPILLRIGKRDNK